MKLQWILLLGACAVVRAANTPPLYDRFLQNHIIERLNTDDCSSVMQNLKLNETGTENCISDHTFIVHDMLRSVYLICNESGNIVSKNIYKSQQLFLLVHCSRSSGTQYPNCSYRGSASRRAVKVSCEPGLQKNSSILWPTHLLN